MTRPDEAERGTAAKPRRWPKVLLAVSLAGNLLVLGLIAGAHFRDDRDARRFPPPDRAALRETGLAPFFDAMPRAARGRMAQDMRERVNALRPDRAALQAEFTAILTALRAEDFDPATLEATLAAQQERMATGVRTGRAVLIAQITAMSAAERAAFADALEKRFNTAREHGPRLNGRGN